MKRVKTDWRLCLKTETLEKLLHISIKGVPLENSIHFQLFRNGGMMELEVRD